VQRGGEWSLFTRRRLNRAGALPLAEWPFFQLGGKLRGYLLAVSAVWAIGMAIAALRGSLAPSQILSALLVLACGAAAVTASRRQDQTAGSAKDLLSPWFLPIALTLPPVYAFAAPVVLMVYVQIRVNPTPLYRRMFSITANGVSLAAASWAFRAVLDSARAALPAADPKLIWTTAALGGAILFTLLSSLLVAIAVRLYSPEATLQSLVLDRDRLLIDVAEVMTGVLVALACTSSPGFALLAVVPVIVLQRGLLHGQLTAAARLDAKTGLLNAPAWETETDSEIARAVRTGTPLSVMLIDLDHFKSVNDRYGHLVGDDVIRAAADVMKAQIREYDRCARFGGDEFAILLPQSDLQEATRTAERIQRQVAAIAVSAGDVVVRTSVSIGVAQLSAGGQGVTDLLAAADLSLYRAKAAGRRRVVATQPTQSQPALIDGSALACET
jgi:diguanylate cyclase (GGDEF)-like protein